MVGHNIEDKIFHRLLTAVLLTIGHEQVATEVHVNSVLILLPDIIIKYSAHVRVDLWCSLA